MKRTREHQRNTNLAAMCWLLGRGCNREHIMVELGISRHTYDRWKAQIPGWLALSERPLGE